MTMVILFLVTSVSLAGYAQGYRIDWTAKRISKTGGFFIKAPAGSTVTVDLVIVKKVNVLGTGILVPNLLPREYQIAITKNGYWDWTKRLKIEAGLTTEIRNVVLIQKEPLREPLSRGVTAFFIAPGGTSIAIEKSDGLWLFDAKKKDETRLAAKPFRVVSWSPDAKKLLLEEPVEKYTVYQIETGIVVPLPRAIEKPKWHPKEMNKIAFVERESRNFFIYDLSTQTSELHIPSVDSFDVTGSEVLFIDRNTKTLFKEDTAGGQRDQLTFSPLEEETTTGMKFFIYGTRVFLLTQAGELLLFDSSAGTLVRQAEHVTDAVFSSLGKSLFYTTSNEIWVTYLEDILIQPFRYKNQRDLITRLSEPIEEAAWYTKDNEHIIFRVGRKVEITELDGRDGRNTVNFIEFTNVHESTTNSTNLMAYNEKDDRLYFLDEGTLYRAKIK